MGSIVASYAHVACENTGDFNFSVSTLATADQGLSYVNYQFLLLIEIADPFPTVALRSACDFAITIVIV